MDRRYKEKHLREAGLAVSFGLFLTPLVIENENDIFPGFTATEREKSQQQHSNSRLYSHISYCRRDAKRS